MEFITTGNRIAVENFDIGKIYTITWETGNYKSLACTGKGTDFVMFQDQEPDLLFCLTMDTAITVESIDEGGGAGTMNYNELENKPSINGIVLVGNKTGADLNLVSQADLDDYATNASVVVGLATKQDALSSSQLQAVNSGITSALVTQIGTNTSAIAGKQDALSSSQLAAVNSGITSADVTQITTNKNNISLLAIKGGGYNFAKIGTNSYTGYGLTLTVANGVITISGTATGNFSLYLSNTVSAALTDDCKLLSQLPTQIAFTGAPDTDAKNRIIFSLYNDSTWVYSGSTNDLYHDLTGKSYNNWLIYMPIVSGNTYNGTWRPMIIDRTVYDSGFTDFQPYAPTNAELYAMIQALQQ